MDAPDLVISDQPDRRRFEARLGPDLVAFLDYRWLGGRLVLAHTEVLPAFEGRGIAGAVARQVLGDARDAQQRVTIKCPYLRSFVERHPEYRPAEDGLIPRAEG